MASPGILRYLSRRHVHKFAGSRVLLHTVAAHQQSCSYQPRLPAADHHHLTEEEEEEEA